MKLKEITWRKSEEEKKENRRREEPRDRKEREEIDLLATACSTVPPCSLQPKLAFNKYLWDE